MPGRDRHPAKFGPIPPDLDLQALVEQTPNFKWVDRISCRAIDEQGIDAFDKTVEQLVIKRGVPLIVDGWNHKLEGWTFSTRWLHDNIGNKPEQARLLSKGENMPLTMSHYLNNLGKLCDQWTHFNYKEPHRQRLYMKDIDCPDLWHEKLRETIPGNVFYLNENTADIGGAGAVEEDNPSGIGTRKSRGIGRAGDLMSCLPPTMRAENLMCYIGHEGTYTPAHREMCASLGQNIMVETSEALDEGGKRAKPGSSIWFMTETHDRQVVSEYWLSTLGHDIEVEKHFAHINAWRKAPFTVYVVEQKLGDMILIPPLAPHQVWNRGTRTMKVAWNRTTVETLELALSEALPRARLVCRDEQYKNKSIILFTLNKYYGHLSSIEERRHVASQRGDEAALKALSGLKIRQLRRDFRRLFHLFNKIMLSEHFSHQLPPERKVEYLPYDSNVTCGYCRGNIFNRFLTCRHCIIEHEDGEEDTYDVCMDCYAMGRSCRCIGKLDWVEQFPWRDLVEKHELWRKLCVQLDNKPKENSFQSLEIERMFMRGRSLAEICQIELRKRPFKDPKKPEIVSEPSDDSNDEDVVASGATKKNPRKKKKSEKWLSENLSCHICCYRHPKWKEAICTCCDLAFCYGSLWRGFDMMPQEILEDRDWLCPRCRQFCTCSHCAKNPGNKAFEPTGTVLGHDTRQFADPRSIESLVDFSVSNRHWIRKSGDVDNPKESRRLQRRQSQAMQQKENAENEGDASDAGEMADADGNPHEMSDSRPGTSDDDIPIDPALVGGSTQEFNKSQKRKEAQSQAFKALQAMDGLSRLELDPIAFRSAADLADRSVDEEDALSAARHTLNSQSDRITLNAEAKVASAKPKKHGRKNERSKDVTESVREEDVEPGTQPPTANQRFQAMAERRRIDQAKKNNSLIAARAAMRGLHKLVTLKLNPLKLSQIRPSHNGVQVKEQQKQEATQETSEVPLVESNLVQPSSQPQHLHTASQVARKRVRNDEIDESFVNFPSKERRTQKQIRELRATAAKDVENEVNPSDDDEIIDVAHSGDDGETATDSRNNISASSKRRSLPAYLARRSEAEPDAPIPKELQSEPRSSARQKKDVITGQPPSVSSHRIASTTATKQSTPSEQIREANHLAKLRAAQGIDSDSDSSDEDMNRTADHVGNHSKANGLATKTVRSSRQSIFASRGRGKIKISGARRR